MLKRLAFPLLIALVATGTVAAKDWWEKKPYIEWTPHEIDRMLNDSPWVALCPAELTRGQLVISRGSEEPAQHVSSPDRRAIPMHSTQVQQAALPSLINYRVRLLTARPIREAFLSELSFSAHTHQDFSSQQTVNVERMKGGDLVSARQARLQQFLAEHPGGTLVDGDERRIIVALTLTQFTRNEAPHKSSDWAEQPRPSDLLEIHTADLTGTTILSTDTGKRVALIQYDRPGTDMLGAKFYFPRTLPDGAPLIGDRDRELRFETRINGKEIKVKFDLRKMRYKGKVEL